MRPLLLIFLFLSTAASAKDIEQIVDEVVSVFENSTTDIQYCAIEDINDGRGFTAGKAGFTTATGDLILVVKAYKENESFRPLIPLLEERAREEDSSTRGLELLPQLWKAACKKQSFIQAQDGIVEELYKSPARKAMSEFNIHSYLGYLIFYDTMIQHGEGSDPDGFYGIINKMPSHPADEETFLKLFLKERIKVLKHATNEDTRDVWKESVDRAHALERLLKQNAYDLKLPLRIHVWGEDFAI